MVRSTLHYARKVTYNETQVKKLLVHVWRALMTDSTDTNVSLYV